MMFWLAVYQPPPLTFLSAVQWADADRVVRR
jgi:hypothetical protein